jgi:hypothetical protein
MILNIIRKLIIGVMLFGAMPSVFAASKVTATLIFDNETHNPITQIQKPYIENDEKVCPTPEDSFLLPEETIQPNTMSKTTLSYLWGDSEIWYGGSQFAYNYAGRSKDYGCFITEIRFSGRLWNIRNYNAVIASYRKDPEHPNDYLMCTVERDPVALDQFKVHFISSQKGDPQAEDVKRYAMVGDLNYLQARKRYGIDKPIPLNPVLNLNPNSMVPQPTSVNPSSDKLNTASSDTVNKFIVINHSNQTLVAGPKVLNHFGQWSSRNYVNQPEKISPRQTVTVEVASARDFQRLNYHVQGYSEDSGCFLTVNAYIDNTFPAVMSYHFDPTRAPEKNLYCSVVYPNIIDVYDYSEALPIAQQCKSSHPEGCISLVRKSTEQRYLRGVSFINSLNFETCYYSFKYSLDPSHEVVGKHIFCRPLMVGIY